MNEHQKGRIYWKMIQVGLSSVEAASLSNWLESVLAEEKIEPKLRPAWVGIILGLGMFWIGIVLLTVGLAVLVHLLEG